MIGDNCMIDALVLKEFVLEMSYGDLNCQVAMLHIAFIALLSVCGNMTAMGSRKLERQAEVAVAVAGRYGGVWWLSRVGLLYGFVCHGECRGRVECDCKHRSESSAKEQIQSP